MPDRRVVSAVAAVVIVAAAAIAVAVLLAHKSSQAASSPSATRQAGTASGTATAAVGKAAAAAGPATLSGPDGVQARWVVQENDKPGTTSWEIHGRHAGITGFASQVYAQAGQRVTLYVSTSGPSFRAQAFRMGYYQGKGARLVWTSPAVTGQNQPRCPVKGGINMVECDNWRPSLTFTVTQAFVQGD